MIKFHKPDTAFLGKGLKSLTVLPISDCHIGDAGFAEKQLKERLYQATYEETIILLMGDIVNNAIRSSVSNGYKEVIQAGDPQIDYATDLLEPVASIIEASVGGNHEIRTTKESNVDIAKHISENLAIPYLGIHGIVQLQFGSNKHGDPVNYFIYMHHGAGGGSSRSGKTKKMLDQEQMINGADIYLRAHSHIIDAFPTSISLFDTRTKEVNKQSIYHISSGNWLDSSDYAEVMELPSLPIGCPTIKLSGKERKIEVTV